MDWLDNAATFSAGAGDSLTFGITWWIRSWYGGNQLLNPEDGWYKGGEWTETGVEIAVTCGGSLLKKAAQKAAFKAGKEYLERQGKKALLKSMARQEIEKLGRKRIQSQARKFTNRFRKEIGRPRGGFVHHADPLFGHPGGVPARFPVGGLPDWLKNGSRNFKFMEDAAQHAQAHRYTRQLERFTTWVWHPSGATAPSRVAARELRRYLLGNAFNPSESQEPHIPEPAPIVFERPPIPRYQSTIQCHCR